MADGIGLNNGRRVAPLVSAPTEEQYGDNPIIKAIQDVSSKISIPSTPFTRDIGSATSTLGDVGLKAGAVAGVLGATGQGLARDAVQYFTGMEGLDLRPAAYEAANQVLFGEGLGGKKTAVAAPMSAAGAAQVPVPVTPPEAPNVAQPLAGGVAAEPSADKWWTRDNWKISGKGGVTPEGEMPTAVRITKGGGTDGSDLLEARGIPMPAGERLTKETFGAVEAMKKRNSIKATRVIADLLKNEYTAQMAGKTGGIEGAKLAWEIAKYAKDNDIKNPQKFMELAAKIAPKTTTYDETGNITVTPNVNEGIKLLQSMGYTLPNGIGPVQQPQITEAAAIENLKRKNITGEKAKKYIEEGKAKGYIK